MQNTDSRNILLSIIGIAILFVAVIGISYAIFMFTGKGMKKNTISTGNISMTYTESDNVIAIDNAVPMSDSAGKLQKEYFDFTVSANINGKAAIDYEIRARRTDYKNNNRLPNNCVNIYLEKEMAGKYKSVLEPKTFIPKDTDLENTYVNKDSMLLYKSTVNSEKNATITDKYRLRIWIKENACSYDRVMTYKLKVDVYSELSKK